MGTLAQRALALEAERKRIDFCSDQLICVRLPPIGQGVIRAALA